MPSDPTAQATVVQGGGQRPASRPWWLGIAVIALGGVWLYGGLSLPQSSRYAAVGPGLFVTLIGAGLVILGGLLLLQIGRGEQFDPQEAEDAAGNEKANHVALLTAFAAAVIPIFTISLFGLPITAMISFTLVARSFGSRRTWLDIIYGAALGTFAWLLFTSLGLQLGSFLPVAGF